MFDAIENRKRPRDCDSARSVFDFIGVPLHGVRICRDLQRGVEHECMIAEHSHSLS